MQVLVGREGGGEVPEPVRVVKRDHLPYSPLYGMLFLFQQFHIWRVFRRVVFVRIMQGVNQSWVMGYHSLHNTVSVVCRNIHIIPHGFSGILGFSGIVEEKWGGGRGMGVVRSVQPHFFGSGFFFF